MHDACDAGLLPGLHPADGGAARGGAGGGGGGRSDKSQCSGLGGLSWPGAGQIRIMWPGDERSYPNTRVPDE